MGWFRCKPCIIRFFWYKSLLVDRLLACSTHTIVYCHRNDTWQPQHLLVLNLLTICGTQTSMQMPAGMEPSGGGLRGMFLLSPTTNAHTCITAGIKKGTDQRIHVQDTCADQWPETAAQTLRFWRGSERPSAYPPARAGNQKNANSRTRKVRPENGPLLAPLSRRVLRK